MLSSYLIIYKKGLFISTLIGSDGETGPPPRNPISTKTKIKLTLQEIKNYNYKIVK